MGFQPPDAIVPALPGHAEIPPEIPTRAPVPARCRPRRPGHRGRLRAPRPSGHRNDFDAARIAGLAIGRPPVFEPGPTEALTAGPTNGSLAFTVELDPPIDARFSFVCVSTPTGPDGPLSTVNVEVAVARLLRTASPDHVIVVRSTPPLDGPSCLSRIVSAAGAANRAAIVTNPEFMREGQALDDFDRPNRVVTGWLERRISRPPRRSSTSTRASRRAVARRGLSVRVLIKLGSNVYLAMKISFANELARVADATGADVEEVIAGIGLDSRIGTAFLTPGPGIGGSCLPEQAVAIALGMAALVVEAPLLSAVHRSNAVHQRQIATRLETLLEGPGSRVGRRIALLGLAFKADTDDVRQSPALALAANLRAAGADVSAHDPRAAQRARRRQIRCWRVVPTRARRAPGRPSGRGRHRVGRLPHHRLGRGCRRDARNARLRHPRRGRRGGDPGCWVRLERGLNRPGPDQFEVGRAQGLPPPSAWRRIEVTSFADSVSQFQRSWAARRQRARADRHGRRNPRSRMDRIAAAIDAGSVPDRRPRLAASSGSSRTMRRIRRSRWTTTGSPFESTRTVCSDSTGGGSGCSPGWP